MSLAAGTRLGHYEIERVLGAGGMGVVYRAFDSRLERPVAIKFLKQEGTADASHRLLSEARSASALNHPNICTIHEVAELGDQCFIVMEYVEGKPLSDVLLSGRPPVDRGLNLAIQVASALAHAHERGVVHGDLKAPNVLLSDREQIKVVDFGLARRQSTDADTVEVITGGTPYAMAPEQVSGGRADSRSDVWSLGVLLQELVSGTRPYTAATTAEYFASIMRDAPTRPPASVPPGIRRTIERCLTREPSRRYQDGAQVLEALQELSGPNKVAKSASPVTTDWSIPLPPALATAAASQIVLIGRDAEWAELRGAWDRARTGRRQLTLLAGEPGIGKTRLITEFARGVGQEAIVLLGRCDQEALVPQQPFVEALEWYARACPPSALDEQLADIDGAWELAQLVAPLKRATMAEPTDANAEGRRYRLFEAVATFISRIAAHRPLLLILEDLHWADRATVLLLRHLLRSSHEASLCIVGTYRETELNKSHPLSEVLADLRREGGVTRIALNGLGEDDVRQFIGQWIGRESPQTLTNLVAGNTEGNPFFVSEVLRHLRETGALDNVGDAATPRALDRLPEGIRETISRRLARLSEECNRVLTLASVIGREFSLPLLAAVSDLSEDRVLDLLDEALAARLLQDVPGVADRYTFTHALVRDTLYETLTPARRSRAHRHTAEVLDRLAAPTARPLADLAHHYALAGTAADAEKAIACAMGAAERAAKTFALEEAARFYGVALKALDLLPQDASVQQRRFDLYFKRGRAFGDLGLWAFARVELEAALPLADTEVRRAEVLIELCKCTFWGLDTAAVRRYSQEAMALSESLGRDDLVAETLSWISGVMNAEGDVPSAVDLDRKAMARVGGPTTFGLARAVISLYHMGLTDEAVSRGYQAVESANASQDPNFRTYALEQLAISLVAAGRYGEATRVFNDMREVGRRHGVLPMLARGIAMNGGMHISLGDYARGEEMSLEARELARRIGFPPAFISAGIDLLTVFARTNNPGRADGLVDEVSKSVVAASGWHGWLWRLRLNQAKAELAIARGDWAEATTEATQCVVDSEARTRPKYVALGLTSRARAQHAAGAQLAASADAARALEVARTLGDPAVILRALCAQLTVDGTDAVREEARAYTQRIAERIEDAPVRARFLASDLAVSSG